MPFRIAAVFPLVFGLLLPRSPAQQSVTLTPVRDNTLFQSTTGGLSNGVGTGLFAGRTDDSTRRRALLAFDLSTIPAGATVTSVQLTLTVTQTNTGTESFNLHRLLVSWGEGTSNSNSGGGGGGAPATTNDATWLHRFWNSTAWAQAGGDFSATSSASLAIGGNGAWTFGSTPGLVSDLQSWLSNPSTNQGWIVVGDETQDQTTKRFASREFATATSRPRLVVGYTAPVPATATIVGTGCTGSGGQPFVLSALGVPSLGNGAFALSLSGGSPGSQAWLYQAIGLEPVPVLFNGCPVYLNVNSLFALAAAGVSPFGPVPLNATGSLTIGVPVPNQASLAGVRVDLQAVAFDNPALGTTVTSNALTLVFGI